MGFGKEDSLNGNPHQDCIIDRNTSLLVLETDRFLLENR